MSIFYSFASPKYLLPSTIPTGLFITSGNRPGPLFLNSDNSPVSRTIFAELLSLSLKACRLDSARYKGHIFRIGAAERGMSDAQSFGSFEV